MLFKPILGKISLQNFCIYIYFVQKRLKSMDHVAFGMELSDLERSKVRVTWGKMIS